MLQSLWRAVALLLIAGLALAWAASALAPRQYLATGGVLVPAGMMKVRYESEDPRAAAALVQGFIDQHKDALLVDPPLVTPVPPSLAGDLALGAIAALVLGFLLLGRRRSRAVRSEGELIEALGEPLLAARPLAPQHLSRQLLAHWFAHGRRVLAVVSPRDEDGRTRVAAELARAFAQTGEPTLLIDADFRAPSLHRAFGLRNRDGLADFLEGRGTQIAHCAENLSVLVAGRSSADPLELLSRGRMLELLAAAATRYRVILVDTPAAARGPDLQLFAAFAGGALVVAKRGSEAAALTRLRDLLAVCKARVVGTVLSPA
jgi:Mrp family chromosome partitioning ATPase